MIDMRASVARWALAAGLIHTVLVVTASAVHNLGWTASPAAWEAGHLFRVVDAPMAWIINPVLQRYSVPPALVDAHVHRLLFVNETLVHSLFGGIFWALVAAAGALLVQRVRAK